jgi:hypothetical protein
MRCGRGSAGGAVPCHEARALASATPAPPAASPLAAQAGVARHPPRAPLPAKGLPLRWCPAPQLLLTAGLDKSLRLFAVDGLGNPLAQAVHVDDLPLTAAEWAGERVLLAGRRPFFCLYDMAAGRVERVAAPAGCELRSLERFALAPAAARFAGRPPPAVRRRGASTCTPRPPGLCPHACGCRVGRVEHGCARGELDVRPLPLPACRAPRSASAPHGAEPLVAFVGDGGAIPLVSLRSRQGVGSLKMSGGCSALAWAEGGRELLSTGGWAARGLRRPGCPPSMREAHMPLPRGALPLGGLGAPAHVPAPAPCAGRDGVVHVWDIRTLRCRLAFADAGAGGEPGGQLAVSPDGRYCATGSASGAVNVYRRADVEAAAAAGGGARGRVSVAPLRQLLNLTTAVDSLTFTADSQVRGLGRGHGGRSGLLPAVRSVPHSCRMRRRVASKPAQPRAALRGAAAQVLAMASRLKRDALRLVHLPSLTVFANWPTGRSPLHFVHTLDFSPHCGLLAVGNARGAALLYRLHHYSAA